MDVSHSALIYLGLLSMSSSSPHQCATSESRASLYPQEKMCGFNKWLSTIVLSQLISWPTASYQGTWSGKSKLYVWLGLNWAKQSGIEQGHVGESPQLIKHVRELRQLNGRVNNLQNAMASSPINLSFTISTSTVYLEGGNGHTP